MNDLAKKDIIGVHVNAVGYDDAVARIIHAAPAADGLRGVSALAVHGLMEGAFDPEHRYRLNSLDLVVPDGTGILWGLNLLHRTRLAERVRGADAENVLGGGGARPADLPVRQHANHSGQAVRQSVAPISAPRNCRRR